MPDNTLLFRQDNNLYRTNKEFTKATLVKTFNFDDWNDKCRDFEICQKAKN
jgi:hypothetical protein